MAEADKRVKTRESFPMGWTAGEKPITREAGNPEGEAKIRIPGSRTARDAGRASRFGGEETRNQGDLALRLETCALRDFLFPVRFEELFPLTVSRCPDLREEIVLAIAVEDELCIRSQVPSAGWHRGYNRRNGPIRALSQNH